MSVNLLSCPHCRSAFKMNKALPMGVDIACPKCKERFTVSNELIRTAPTKAPAAAGAAASSANGRSNGVMGRPSAPQSRPTHPPSTPDYERQPTPSGGGGKGRTIVLVLILLLLAGGGFAGYWFYLKPADTVPPIEPRAVGNKDGGNKAPPSGPSNQTTIGSLNLNAPKDTPPAQQNPKDPKDNTPPGMWKGDNGLVLTDAEKQQVDALKKQGVAYLNKFQKPDGTWDFPDVMYKPAMAAMGGLTLLSCGETDKSLKVQKAAEFVRQSADTQHNTYGLAFSVLFLDKLNDPADTPLIRKLSARLIAGQLPDGSWDYDNPSLSVQEERDLYRFLESLGKTSWQEYYTANSERCREMPYWLNRLSFLKVPNVETPEWFKQRFDNDWPQIKNRGEKQRIGNNSTTQLALLALWAAKRAHEVPAHHTLYLTVKRFRNTQNEDGSWPYSFVEAKSDQKGGAMNCAGLLALTIGYALELPRPYPTVMEDPAVKKGLEAVEKEMGKYIGEKRSAMNIYAFWSLERVGVLYKMGKFGEHDWFRWGLRTFPNYNHKDGGWFFDAGNGFAPCADSCFVLLFLQQVNLIKWEQEKGKEVIDPFKPNLSEMVLKAAPDAGQAPQKK